MSPFDQQSLQQALIAAGCSTTQYAIGMLGDDCECLIEQHGEWLVVYAERGNIQMVLFRSTSEAEACAFLWQRMQQRIHMHLVGLFASEHEASGFVAALSALGIAAHIDIIPATIMKLHVRVFVVGTAIFLAREHFPQLPLRSWPYEAQSGMMHAE